MESADLRIFQAVAYEGSITKAALRLGYVQSNVTARIRQLESEIGTALFHRHNRGMTLSSSGQTLLAYADKIIGLLDEAALALSPSSEPGGPLLIGASQTTAAVRLPRLLSRYYEMHPKVELTLTTDLSDRLMEKVLQYELDVAFISTPCRHPELTPVSVFDEEVVVISAPWIIELDDALTKPNLVYSKGCSYREILEGWQHSRGIRQLKTMEFGTLEAILGGVSSGLGISLVPRVVAEMPGNAGSLRIHEVPEALRRMKTELIYRKDAYMTPALRALLKLLGVSTEEHEQGQGQGQGQKQKKKQKKEKEQGLSKEREQVQVRK
ncbi:LysR family transcriptional regulator [Paenibacillus sp. alder61]|uniref:LysR substrate-binding domain-containing protein n=1 Tax=Paenibacillus sp. alder61 TaxID=2862948 RepID=UPI001CD51942|nr:LysR substrate-binding domain-containing protein [Paenibacillus sp. alder61]MCA1292880.1 LysR family transcriptional regulator [Paenibacillus sp. alder61]